jgi:uncharacterized membrane protein YfcA
VLGASAGFLLRCGVFWEQSARDAPLWALNWARHHGARLVVSSWLRCEFTISPRLEKILNPPAGFISGFINGLTNAAGPALAIYLYSLRLVKREFIRSIATMFMVTKLSQLAAVSTWNLFNRSTLALSLEVTLFILLGFYAGLKTQDRINKEAFSRWLLLLLFIVGVTLILRALAQAG